MGSGTARYLIGMTDENILKGQISSMVSLHQGATARTGAKSTNTRQALRAHHKTVRRSRHHRRRHLLRVAVTCMSVLGARARRGAVGPAFLATPLSQGRAEGESEGGAR